MRALPLLLLLALPAFAQQDAPTRVATLLKADVDSFDLEGLSRTELMKLKFQLQESRPGLVSPVVMLGGGGLLDVLGLAALAGASIGYSGGYGVWTSYASGAKAPSGTAYAAFVVGSVFVVAGALLIVCGATRLSRYLPVRRLAAFKVELVDVELAKQPVLPAAPASEAPAVP